MKKRGLIKQYPLLNLESKSYLNKILSAERQNLAGCWLQKEGSGLISYDYSGNKHDGTYTDVTLGQAGVPGMGYTSPLYDGTASFNNIYSAGLVNDNLLSNPGFETPGGGDPDFWANWTETVQTGSFANETVLVYEGNDAAKINAGGGIHVRQSYVSIPEKKYRLRIWTRGDGTNSGRYLVRDITNATNIVSVTSCGVPGAAYEMVVVEYTAPAGCIEIEIQL